MLKRSIALFFLTNLTFAQSFQSYNLGPGKSVSELLNYELGILSIYGPAGPLEQVLRINELTYESARFLPIGHEIKVPQDLLKDSLTDSNGEMLITPEASEPESSGVPENVVAENDPTFIHHWEGYLKGGAFFINGESDEFGTFSGSGPFLGGQLNHRGTLDTWLFRTQIDGGGYLYKSEAKSEIIPQYSLRFSTLRHVSEAFKVGLGAGIHRDFFILIDGVGNEEIVSGFIPKYHVTFEYLLKSTLINLDIGISSPASAGSGNKTESYPFALLGSRWNWSDSIDLKFEVSYENREVETFKQTYIETSFFIGKSF